MTLSQRPGIACALAPIGRPDAAAIPGLTSGLPGVLAALKAEYRYTRFQDRTVTENSNQSSSSSGATSSSSSVAAVQSSRISGLDWHTVTIGVSHYFDAN